MKVKPLIILLCACASLFAENAEEKKLMKKFPRQAEIAIGLKYVLEKMTREKFGRNVNKDESDGYRHFVGSILLTNEFGPALALRFLNAHETGPGNTKPERQMDFDNNRKGIEAAALLKKSGPITPERASDLAMQYLREGKIVVLEPKGMPGNVAPETASPPEK